MDTKRLISRIVLATTSLCGAVLMTACSGSLSIDATNSTTGQTSAPTQTSAEKTLTKEGGGSAQVASVPRCHTNDLSISFGEKKNTNTAQSVQGQLGALDHEAIALVYTNTSGHACTMYGFGGVDLHGPAVPAQDGNPVQGPVFSATRAGTRPTTVRLEPGGAAHMRINYMVPTGGAKWTPTAIVVTPPNETTSRTLSWSDGDAVLLYDGGQKWGPVIDPVAAGSRLG